MTRWNPKLYLQYEDHRTRPSVELLARVDVRGPNRIYDLGCGPGNSTRVLRQRWPKADITGVDNDEDMLLAARSSDVKAEWTSADIGAWTPETPADLVFSNGSLHWLGNHEGLFLKLISAVRSGGVLAVQMPRNFTSPSHTIIQQVVENGPWADALSQVQDFNPVARPEVYYEYLFPHTATLDIWETEYVHVLNGDDPVFNWISGTALTPYVSRLDGKDLESFIRQCKEKLANAYCKHPNGATLFSFRRLFIVATSKE